MNILRFWLPVLPGIFFSAEGDGGGSGEGDGDKGKGNEGGDKVPKADFDALQAKNTEMAQELSEIRSSILSDDYIAFLEAKEKGGKKEEGGKGDLGDEDLEKLSKKELIARAKKIAEDAAKSVESKFEQKFSESERARNERAVKEFSASHEDFEIYRPIMYGLSIDPKNKDKGLGELYELAKSHVGDIHKKVSDVEKEKQKKMGGEKPGSSSESYEKLRKLSGDAAAKEALEETKAKLGPIPSL